MPKAHLCLHTEEQRGYAHTVSSSRKNPQPTYVARPKVLEKKIATLPKYPKASATYSRKEHFAPYAKEKSAIRFNDPSIFEHTVGGNDFPISFVTLDPGNQRPQVSTLAYEFVCMISGRMKFHPEETVLDLHTGDALFFDGRIRHTPVNQEDTPTTYLIFYFFAEEPETE